MPRGTFGEQYTGSTQLDQFASLKMETGDYARVLVPEDEGYYEYVHSMRAPELDGDDMPVIINRPLKAGGTRPDYNMRFVGQRICLGDFAVIEDKKIDPERCPADAAAQRGVPGMVPERRFALPVIVYNPLNKKSPDVRLQNPPGATVKVWKLSQRMYDQLMAYKAEMRALLRLPEDYDLSTLPLHSCDIVLYCEDGNFQRVTFKTPREAAHKHPAVAALVKALWGDEANRPTDAQLKAACGKDNLDPEARKYMTIDVETVENNWRMAERVGLHGTRRDPTGSGPLAGATDLAAGLDDLFGPPAAAVPAASSGLDEFGPSTSNPAAVANDPAAVANDPDGGNTRAAAAVPAAAGDDLFGPSPAAASPAPTDDPFASPAMAAAPAASSPAATRSFSEIIDGLGD